MENTFLSFNAFKTINEKDEKSKEEAKKKEPVEIPKEDKVDTSGGQYKEMNINGKDYMAILSTLTAIGSKQEAMGEKKVGIVSLPGDEKVYELVPKGEDGEEQSNESVVNEDANPKVKEEAISRLADFFRVSPSNLKKFNFDGKDNIKDLTRALNSTSDEGTKLYYETAIKLAKEDVGVDESRVNEDYIEVMNLPELANALGKIAELWKQWKTGPMTEPGDIRPAQRELKGWIDRWFKDNIK